MRARVMLLLLLGALAAPAATAQDRPQTPAERVDEKLQAIIARGIDPPSATGPVTTTFTESEINSYLRAIEDLPPGLKQPTVRLMDGSRLDFRALIDLDAVRLSEERGLFDPMRYVTGILEVQAVGILRGTNGQGTYHLDSARVGGAPVPRFLLDEMLAYYTRTPELPSGVQLDTPFNLPSRIRELELRLGLATVIQ